MKLFKITLLILIFSIASSQQIDCVGSSITANGYPEIVDFWMEQDGFVWNVYNFGVPGAGVINNPYKNTLEFNNVLERKSDYVLMMLGANDRCDYSGNEEVWKTEYQYLIRSFKNKSKVILGTILYQIYSGENNITDRMNIAVKQIATANNLKVIDFDTAIGTNPLYYQADGIHPSEEGKYQLARTAYNYLKTLPLPLIATLTAPNNFNAYFNDNDKCIDLNWNSVPNAQSYRINRSNKNADGQWVYKWYDNINSTLYNDYDLSSNMTYLYSVQAFACGVYGEKSKVLMISLGMLSDLNETTTNTIFSLGPNYPNPFNPITTIEYFLPIDSQAIITIYDLLGNKVKTLINEYQVSGNHKLAWNGTNILGQKVVGGVYLYTLQVENFTQTRKMVLLK